MHPRKKLINNIPSIESDFVNKENILNKRPHEITTNEWDLLFELYTKSQMYQQKEL